MPPSGYDGETTSVVTNYDTRQRYEHIIANTARCFGHEMNRIEHTTKKDESQPKENDVTKVDYCSFTMLSTPQIVPVCRAVVYTSIRYFLQVCFFSYSYTAARAASLCSASRRKYAFTSKEPQLCMACQGMIYTRSPHDPTWSGHVCPT